MRFVDSNIPHPLSWLDAPIPLAKAFSGPWSAKGFRLVGRPEGAQFPAMSYLTLEVEIDHGRVLPKGPETLPEKASD